MKYQCNTCGFIFKEPALYGNEESEHMGCPACKHEEMEPIPTAFHRAILEESDRTAKGISNVIYRHYMGRGIYKDQVRFLLSQTGFNIYATPAFDKAAEIIIEIFI